MTGKELLEKLSELKHDTSKLAALLETVMESENEELKEMLAEMMFYLFLTEGEEIDRKFKEIEELRKLEIEDISDWGWPQPTPPYQTGPIWVAPNTTDYTFPSTSWDISSTTYQIKGDSPTVVGDGSGGTLNVTSSGTWLQNHNSVFNTVDFDHDKAVKKLHDIL